MASYLDKFQINTAITDNTKLDLSHQHITTADFFQFNVSNIMELVPGSKLDFKMESFARMNPLVVPTFGRASIRHRAFFVPFRTIFRGWTDFITDAPHVASDGYSPGDTATLISNVPRISTEDLIHAFLDYVSPIVPGASNYADASTDGGAMLYQVTPNSSNSNWDVTWTYNGVTYYYCYTVKGRQCLKILESLGYKLDFVHFNKSLYVSALPLLALAKIYADWYYPQQYSSRTEYDMLLSLCNMDVAYTSLSLSAAVVVSILQIISYVCYDSDLFVSAFDQPNSPNADNYSNFTLRNIDTIGSYYGSNLNTLAYSGVVTNNSATPTSSSTLYEKWGNMNAPFLLPQQFTGSGSNTTSGISQYILHSLHALSDYMKRHQLSGSRAFERYLSRFGKALPVEKLNRCTYIGSHVQDIQVNDVTSTADTASSITGSQLGALAGKGGSYGSGNFEYSTDEFGYFIVISSIVPATGYFQGIDPMVMRTHKLEFFTPEFDSLGVEPIKAANLYIPQIPGQMSTGDPYEQVFGFVPRYASYKAPTCMDRLTGNFRVPSINGGNFFNGSGAWHLMREFKSGKDFNNNYANVVHSPGFIQGGSDFSQYKRLFYENAADSPDNFTIINNFEIAEYAPMKPLYDEYEFEDKGKKITIESNGVKLN